jgi:hypothetical protein
LNKEIGDKFKDLANRIYSIVTAPSSLSATWVFYLISEDFDEEPELRNKIFVIYVLGLTDSCWEYREKINNMRINAGKIKSKCGKHYLNCIIYYFDAILDLLSIFNLEEMIFLSELRHQYVHGHWSEIHKESRRVRYVKNGLMVAEKISSDMYWKFFRDLGGGDDTMNIDNSIEKLREKFSVYKTLFWSIDAVFRTSPFIKLMQEDILNNGEPRAILRFDPRGYEATKVAAGENVPNLFDMRAKATISGGRRQDPIIDSASDHGADAESDREKE